MKKRISTNSLKTTKEYKCIHCGKTFKSVRKRKYCNYNCRAKYNYKFKTPKIHTLICQACGVSFETKYKHQKTCGIHECRLVICRNRARRIKDVPVIDPIREPYVQEMIAKYAEIDRILKENGLSMSENSAIVDYELEKIRLRQKISA